MKKVCIVDDQQISLDAVSLLLNKSSNLELVGSFTSAEEYLHQYEILQADITIMDLDLRGVTGIEAIIAIKSNDPHAKVLVLTNYSDEDKIFNALKVGADGYLLKKDSYTQLESAIMSILDGGSAMTPEIARKVFNYFRKINNLAGFHNLTLKEKIILEYLVNGYLYKEIAEKLSVSIDVIKNSTPHIYQKLQVRSRSEAVKKYFAR